MQFSKDLPLEIPKKAIEVSLKSCRKRCHYQNTIHSNVILKLFTMNPKYEYIKLLAISLNDFIQNKY